MIKAFKVKLLNRPTLHEKSFAKEIEQIKATP